MRLDWKGALGILVSAALLAWTLRGESLAEIWQVARQSQGGLLVAMTLTATSVFPIRALRWAVILEPVAKVPFGPLWRAIAIGMMANNILPARAGEFARAYTLAREVPAVSFAAALGSLVVDRIMDALAVAILLFLSLALSPFPDSATVFGYPLASLARFAAAFGTVPLAGVVLMAVRPGWFEALASRLLRLLLPRLHDRLLSQVRSVMRGLGSLSSPGRFIRILGYALVMWTVAGFSFWLGFRAVGIEAPFVAALFVQGLIAFAVAVPSSPGFFGVFEYFGKEGLRLYGVPGELALSWALVYHILTFLPITLFGLYHVARLGLRVRDFGTARAAAP